MTNWFVPLDDSEVAQYAFNFAISFMRPSVDHLYLMHVEVPGQYFVSYTTPEMLTAMRRVEEEKGRKILVHYGHKAKQTGIKFTMMKGTDSNVGSLLCKAIKDYKIDTVVIGRRLLGSFERFFSGSTSKYMVENAECNVIVVKQPFGPAEEHLPKSRIIAAEEHERIRRLEDEGPAEIHDSNLENVKRMEERERQRRMEEDSSNVDSVLKKVIDHYQFHDDILKLGQRQEGIPLREEHKQGSKPFQERGDAAKHDPSSSHLPTEKSGATAGLSSSQLPSQGLSSSQRPTEKSELSSSQRPTEKSGLSSSQLPSQQGLSSSRLPTQQRPTEKSGLSSSQLPSQQQGLSSSRLPTGGLDTSQRPIKSVRPSSDEPKSWAARQADPNIPDERVPKAAPFSASTQSTAQEPHRGLAEKIKTVLKEAIHPGHHTQETSDTGSHKETSWASRQADPNTPDARVPKASTSEERLSREDTQRRGERSWAEKQMDPNQPDARESTKPFDISDLKPETKESIAELKGDPWRLSESGMGAPIKSSPEPTVTSPGAVK